MQIFLLFALLIAVLAVIFTMQNTAPTTLTFAMWKSEQPLALVLLVSLAVGALISIFFSLPTNIKARWTIRQQRKKMSEMDASIIDLKAQLEAAENKLGLVQGITPPTPEENPEPETDQTEVQI